MILSIILSTNKVYNILAVFVWILGFSIVASLIYYLMFVFLGNNEETLLRYKDIVIGKTTKKEVKQMFKGLRPKRHSNNRLVVKYIDFTEWDGGHRNKTYVEVFFNKEDIVTDIKVERVKHR